MQNRTSVRLDLGPVGNYSWALRQIYVWDPRLESSLGTSDVTLCPNAENTIEL